MGASNVLADAMAMGAGEYLSSRSYNNYVRKEMEREKWRAAAMERRVVPCCACTRAIPPPPRPPPPTTMGGAVAQA